MVVWMFGCSPQHSKYRKRKYAHYNYQYVLNELNVENLYGGQTILASYAEDLEGYTISIYGVDDNSFIDLKYEVDDEIFVESGYYITRLLAMLYDVEVNDTMQVMHPLSTQNISFEAKVL